MVSPRKRATIRRGGRWRSHRVEHLDFFQVRLLAVALVGAQFHDAGLVLGAAAGGSIFAIPAKANHQGAFDAGIRGAAGGRVDEVAPALRYSGSARRVSVAVAKDSMVCADEDVHGGTVRAGNDTEHADRGRRRCGHRRGWRRGGKSHRRFLLRPAAEMIETEFIIFAGGVRGGFGAGKIKGGSEGAAVAAAASGRFEELASFHRMLMVMRVERLEWGLSRRRPRWEN